MNDPKAYALAHHFDASEEEVSDLGHNLYEIASQPGEYLVLDETEAEQAWEESLDSYLDDCILSDLKGVAAQYFDRDAWKRDARHDGRGHCLSSYDGNEEEVQVDGEWIYIYRVN